MGPYHVVPAQCSSWSTTITSGAWWDRIHSGVHVYSLSESPSTAGKTLCRLYKVQINNISRTSIYMIFIASLSANDQSNTVHTPIIRINKPHTQFFTLRWLYSPRVYDSGLNLLVQEWEVGGEGWRKTSTQISLLHHQTSAPQRERISYMVSNYILYGVYCLALATISYIYTTLHFLFMQLWEVFGTISPLQTWYSFQRKLIWLISLK